MREMWLLVGDVGLFILIFLWGDEGDNYIFFGFCFVVVVYVMGGLMSV